MWGTKRGTYLARDQNEVDKFLEPAAVPCHFALIFHERKLHQGSRQRREKEQVRELAQFSKDKRRTTGQMPPLWIAWQCVYWAKITSDGQE